MYIAIQLFCDIASLSDLVTEIRARIQNVAVTVKRLIELLLRIMNLINLLLFSSLNDKFN